jgi:general secretion pathway protein G
MKIQYKNDKGFTFIETVVTLAIILIMTAGVGFSAIRYIDGARIASCKSQIETFRLALQSYYIQCGVFPTQAQGLSALWEKPFTAPVPAAWDGPYLDKQIPKDPWGYEYIYKNPGDKNLPWSITSYGADGREGGEGQNVDILSWQ